MAVISADASHIAVFDSEPNQLCYNRRMNKVITIETVDGKPRPQRSRSTVLELEVTRRPAYERVDLSDTVRWNGQDYKPERVESAPAGMVFFLMHMHQMPIE